MIYQFGCAKQLNGCPFCLLCDPKERNLCLNIDRNSVGYVTLCHVNNSLHFSVCAKRRNPVLISHSIVLAEESYEL